jgi:Bacterial protein of unknown function (DUF899)
MNLEPLRRGVHLGYIAGPRVVLYSFSRRHLRCVLPRPVRRERPVPRLHGLGEPWYSARDSLDTLLVGRRIGSMHIVCYLRQGSNVFETYWTTVRGVEAMDNSYRLLDLTGQESWEDSPPAGHNSAPSPGLTAARPIGHQCQCGRADAPSPSGLA